MTSQFYLTPSAGKRLIAKAVLLLPEVQTALTEGTVVVIMGTTNAYIANEILSRAGSSDRVAFKEFHRGILLPAGYERKPATMRGDLVVEKGTPSFTLELEAVCAKLKESDVIFKGANAVNLELNQAGVLIGARETFGTAGIALRSKARVIFPVGVEKRMSCDLKELEAELNTPENKGLGLRCAEGAFTELDAVRLLCGVKAKLIAGGGVCGAEGGCYFMAEGSEEQLSKLSEAVKEVSAEPAIML
ncbi:MAG: hypothetical protein GX942_01240 [Papillibacter sp.]|jgi:hypothetical protein|nr:hypothetical protein [Papillibacter sp.]